jgi:uncharacterized membrane protein YfcA
MEYLAAYLLLGAFAGTVAGLLGVGGGLVIVPALALLYEHLGISGPHTMHLAIGTSLATIIVTSLSSVYAHHRRGAVLWPVFAAIAPGLIVGALLGAAVADHLRSDMLRIAFGVFELLVALQMWFGARPAPHRQLLSAYGMTVAGIIIGFVSAIIGIGGGTMTVPFLAWSNVPIHQAVATSAAGGFPIAVAGAIGFIVTGFHEPGLPDYSFGYLYLPAFLGIIVTSILFAPLGARLAHALPTAQLKKFFALFLAVLGLRMLWI